MPDEQPVGITVLAESTVLVPSLFWFEFRNLLLVSERRGRISPEQTATILAELARLPLEIDDRPQEHRVLGLARRHRLSVYDATYLELAERRGARLATLDRRLAIAAADEGIAVATPA
jgi:predicted nucleic acid-binding protein